MLSYRHAFHAGNHADVLKHLILLQIAEYMGEKPAPFWIIDTHAGAGRYALESAHASKLGRIPRRHRPPVGQPRACRRPPRLR
jgi:23S rRNA (adenine2030-N6)-methyltransferase